ncbi:MAG: hypothetical protein WCF85_15845 [Rhodospirillaceae bacterium]
MESINGVMIQHLSTFMSSVAKATSLQTAKKLSDAWGGTKRYIAAKPNEKSATSLVVGLEDATKIAEIYGGEWVDVSHFPKAPLKKQLILESSESARKTAQACGVSERYVRMVRVRAGL